MFLTYLLWNMISSVNAQINIYLPEINIRNRDEYKTVNSAGTYNYALGLVPRIEIKANISNFDSTVGGTSTVPLNLANIKLNKIGEVILLGTHIEQALSTSYQAIYVAIATIGVTAAVSIDVRLVTNTHTWISGIYSAPVQFKTGTLLNENQISPRIQDFFIHVPAFITPDAGVYKVDFNVNNFSYFRNETGIDVIKTLIIDTTVPFLPSIAAGNSTFNFTTSFPYNTIPTSPVNSLAIQLTDFSNSIPIYLSNVDQRLTSNTGLEVPTTNRHLLNNKFSINSAQLKANFVQAGSYSIPLVYSFNKLSAAYPTGNLQTQKNGTLEVVVSDMYEMTANQSSINFAFTSPSQYQSGMNIEMPQQLKISKTSPYNLYVRASTSSFSSGGNQIPLNVMRIGPVEGETGMNTITLSTVSQPLIQAGNPVIDKLLNIQYSIPSTETPKFLGKPSGLYATDIVFSFVSL